MTTTTTKHTPGPWTISHESDGAWIYGGLSPKDNAPALARVYPDSRWHNSKANARLIAAAPQLLKACKDLIDFTSETPASQKIMNARAAIAKAEGRQE